MGTHTDWSFVQAGNYVANSVAAGDCDKVKNQHPPELEHEDPFILYCG